METRDLENPSVWGLCVDGETADGTLGCEPGAVAPFYVFDIARQENVAGPFDGLRDAVKAGRMIARAENREFWGHP